MTENEIMQEALAQGFSAAAVVDTGKIVFDPAFRPYCAENLCGQYGANYSCPPTCGSPEEMRAKVLAYRRALFLQSEWQVPDLSDKKQWHTCKDAHNAAMHTLLAKLRGAGLVGFMIGASACTLCRPCRMGRGEACPYPQKRFSCLSAYCIYVKHLAEECHIRYDYQNGILPFFGMYVFDPIDRL